MRLHEGRDEKKINEATMSISERFLYEAIRGLGRFFCNRSLSRQPRISLP